jgi:hypothetical protein
VESGCVFVVFEARVRVLTTIQWKFFMDIDDVNFGKIDSFFNVRVQTTLMLTSTAQFNILTTL